MQIPLEYVQLSKNISMCGRLNDLNPYINYFHSPEMHSTYMLQIHNQNRLQLSQLPTH